MINVLIDKKNLLNNKEYMNKLNNLKEIINNKLSFDSQEEKKFEKSLKLSIELIKLIESFSENNDKNKASINNNSSVKKKEDKTKFERKESKNLKENVDMNTKKSNNISSIKSKTKLNIIQDDDPVIIAKFPINKVEYIQELAIRYLKPTTPEPPGEIIINQLPDKVKSPAPPIIIRQQPPRPHTPEPFIIREKPPSPPPEIKRKTITISGKKLPPPGRQVIVERLPPLPPKPQSIIVEKWLPYPQSKRKVIYNKSNESDTKVSKPKNVIINWEISEPQIKKEIRYLGIVKTDPIEYFKRYKNTLKESNNLPSIVNEVPTPSGLILAADLKKNKIIKKTSSNKSTKFVNLNDTFELSEKRKSTTPNDKTKQNELDFDIFSLSSQFETISEKERVLSFIRETNNSIDFDNLSTFSSLSTIRESGRSLQNIKSCS